MMSWHGWILFVMVETMLCLAPGPAVLLVLSQGLTFGWRGSIAANLGILAGAVAWQVAVLGVTSVAIEFVVLAAYGGLAGRARLLAARPRFAWLVDRLSGLLLMAAGLGMALLRRTVRKSSPSQESRSVVLKPLFRRARRWS
jgi:threonine/homoserine/homoserine lactone efflux protein